MKLTQIIVGSMTAASCFVSIQGFTSFHRQQQVSFARGSTAFQFRYVSSSSSLWGSMEDLAREWASRNSEEGGTGRGTMLTEPRDPSMPPGGQSFGTMAKPDDKVKDWVMGDDDAEVGSTMPTAANGAPPGDGVMMDDLAQQWTSLSEDQGTGAGPEAVDGGASTEAVSARGEPVAVNVGEPPVAAAPPPTNGMDELAKQWASVNADHDSASTMPPVSAFVPPPPPPPPPPRDGDAPKPETVAKPTAPSVNMEDLARQWASVNADHDEDDTTATSAPKETTAPMAPPVGYLSPQPRTVEEPEPVVAEEEPEPVVEEPEPEPEPAKKSPPEPEPIVAVGQDVPTREFDGAPLQLAFWFLASCLALLPLGMGDLDPTKWTSIPGPALRPEVLERREQQARLGTTTPPTSEASPPTPSISGFFGLKPLEKKQPVGKIPSAFFSPKQEPTKTETKEEEAPASKFSEPVSPTKEEAAAAAVAAEQETAKKFSEPVSQTKEDADAAAAAAQTLEQDLAAKKFTEPTSALKPLAGAVKEEKEETPMAPPKTEEAKLESLTSKLFAPIKEKAEETKTEASAPETEAAPAPEAKVEEPKVTSPVKEETPAAPPKTEESTLESLAAKLFSPAKEKTEDTKMDAAAPKTEAAPVAKEEDKSVPTEPTPEAAKADSKTEDVKDEKALEPIKAVDVAPKEEPKPGPPKEEPKPEPVKAEAMKPDTKKEKAKKAESTPEPVKASKPEPVKAVEETNKAAPETPMMKAEPAKVVEAEKDEKAPAPVFETFEDVMGQLKK